MPIFKNITRRKIRILQHGRKIIVAPQQTVEGPEFFSNYKGLVQVGESVNPPSIPKQLQVDSRIIPIEVPIEEVIINDNDDSIEIYIEDVKNENKIIENAKKETNTIEYRVLKETKNMNTDGKIDLSDVTFTIPVGIESQDRKNNLTLIIDYLGKHFKTNIIVCESGKSLHIKDFWKPEWASYTKCLFMENKTDFFYKTRILNKMAELVKTPIVVSYDSDVLMYPELYVKAANAIRSGEYDFCYPFNKPLKHILRKDFRTIRETLNIASVEKHTTITHQGIPPGGCFFMNREKFIEGGMENENMISWGPEDQERLDRFRKLGYKVGSLEGYLYHVDHLITQNSSYSNPLYKNNVKEHEKILRMTETELKDYIKTWRHVCKK